MRYWTWTSVAQIFSSRYRNSGQVQKFWSGTENLVRVRIFLSGYRFSRQVQKFSSSSENWWWKVLWSAIKSSITYVVIFCYKNSTTVNHWDLVKSFHHQFSELDENFCTWLDFLYLDKKICALTKKICTLTRKSVPWRENLYLDKKICTWRENLSYRCSRPLLHPLADMFYWIWFS